MPRKPSIALVGAGNLAASLGPALRRAGYRVTAVVVRDLPGSRRRAQVLARRLGARVLTTGTPIRADVLWLCVNDDAITGAARALAGGWQGNVALHSSGALPAALLTPLRRRGTSVASLHPMMTFVADTPVSLAGVSFAIEGDPPAVRLARRIARDLGGDSFLIPAAGKTLYHAMGSFSSPLLVTTLALAEQVGRAAGIPPRQAARAMRPIVRQTVENWLRTGPHAAFSGPLRRADLATVRNHLRELKKLPAARAAYLALARAAVEFLPMRDRKAVARLLR